MILDKFSDAKKPESSDYWRTPEGINQRLDMLGGYFTYSVTNNSLKVYGADYGVSGFMWVTYPEDSKTGVCPICARKHGNIYKSGQFLPSLPAHTNCKCQWTLLFAEPETILSPDDMEIVAPPEEPPYQPPTEPSGEALVTIRAR